MEKEESVVCSLTVVNPITTKIIKSMTQRKLQLNQYARSVVLLLVALNSICTFFSNFEKVLTDRESKR